MEGLGSKNGLGESLGQRYSRVCSLPQGCPRSTLAVSLLIRVWITQLRPIGMDVRSLADDLLLSCWGDAVSYTHLRAHETSAHL
eukprot:9759389-Alexandrium_andersonii.AAC.1